jgi:acetoin utilization deacetylase AcuC-like enzyme
MKVKVYKPWLDIDDLKDVLFVSVHLYDGSFYPGTGREAENTGEDEVVYPGGILNVPCPLGTTGLEWRQKFLTDVLPRVQVFKPDFVVVSAGFDAHKDDHLNGGDSNVIEQDYYWVTQKL